MKRKKWQYSTREAAESAAREFGLHRDHSAIALNAAINGTILRLPRQYGDEGAYYTFGLVPRLSMPIVVVTFHCPQTGQQSHSAVYPETWLNEEIQRWANWPADDLQRAYREGLYDLRVFLHEQCANAA